MKLTVPSQIFLPLLLVAIPMASLAAGHGDHAEHESLAMSESLTFSKILEQAISHAPESMLNDIRQEQARTYTALGKRWIVDAPRWDFSYVDDGPIDNVGLREIETGVEFNLWRPGQRRDAQVYGTRQQARSEAWLANLHLMIAGRLRSVIADIQKAESLLELEQQATGDAEHLLDITTRLYEAEAVPQLDVLQAEALLLEQQQVEMQAEAALVDAERDYRMITGLDTRPSAPYLETRTPQEEIDSSHPMLYYLQTISDLEKANVQKVSQQGKGSPTMRLGVRRERGDQFTPYTDSIGVSVSVPFGGKAVVNARVSDARSDQVEAEVELARTHRTLNRHLHEVEHEMFLTRQALQLSERQAVLGQRRWEMARNAFEAGETDLTSVVIALQNARKSEYEFQALQLRQQRLISDYNQTIGVLP